MILPANVAGIALYGVNHVALHLFHNAHVIRLPVQAVCLPIEKDDIAGIGRILVIPPQTAGFEPLLSRANSGKFGKDTGFDVPALIRTPAHKTGAPFHTAAKTIPAPVGFAAYIPNLR